ncbi:MAG: hypothetical protein PVF58_08190 [Candidatus Methanofastidiosia archaeon]
MCSPPVIPWPLYCMITQTRTVYGVINDISMYQQGPGMKQCTLGKYYEKRSRIQGKEGDIP